MSDTSKRAAASADGPAASATRDARPPRAAPDGDPVMREGKRFRQAGLLVSGLMQTPDCALEMFRDGRNLDGALPLESLSEARQVLDALHGALTGPAEPASAFVAKMFALCFPEEAAKRAAERAAAPTHRHESPAEPPVAAAIEASVPSSPPPFFAPVPVPPPPAANRATAPSDSSRKPGIDFAALNQLRVSEEAPGTMGLDAGILLRPALPFRDEAAESAKAATGAAEAPASGSTRAVATPAAGPTDAAPRSSSRADQAAAESARPTTPFRTLLMKARDPGEPSAPLPAEPPPGPPPAPRPVGAQPSPGPAPGATGGAGQSHPTVPELSVEQCALLFAECVTQAATRSAVWARYGVDGEQGYRALELAWRQRFARDPALFQRWNALYAHYCRWFAQQPPPGPRR